MNVSTPLVGMLMNGNLKRMFLTTLQFAILPYFATHRPFLENNGRINPAGNLIKRFFVSEDVSTGVPAPFVCKLAPIFPQQTDLDNLDVDTKIMVGVVNKKLAEDLASFDTFEDVQGMLNANLQAIVKLENTKNFTPETLYLSDHHYFDFRPDGNLQAVDSITAWMTQIFIKDSLLLSLASLDDPDVIRSLASFSSKTIRNVQSMLVVNRLSLWLKEYKIGGGLTNSLDTGINGGLSTYIYGPTEAVKGLAELTRKRALEVFSTFAASLGNIETIGGTSRHHQQNDSAVQQGETMPHVVRRKGSSPPMRDTSRVPTSQTTPDRRSQYGNNALPVLDNQAYHRQQANSNSNSETNRDAESKQSSRVPQPKGSLSGAASMSEGKGKGSQTQRSPIPSAQDTDFTAPSNTNQADQDERTDLVRPNIPASLRAGGKSSSSGTHKGSSGNGEAAHPSGGGGYMSKVKSAFGSK
ncbi:hypothetical protein HWV62_39297 [Athelia sp. TMB]|nr:hypothetical protein HWV62_39297 [Athelia sp. TMB]